MKEINELLKNSIDTIQVEKIEDDNQLSAHVTGAKMIMYRELCLPIRQVYLKPDSNTFHIDDTVYMLDPLPEEMTVIYDAKILLMGLIAEAVFTGELNTKKINDQFRLFKFTNSYLFSDFDECLYFLLWQLKSTIKIFTEEIVDIKRFSEMLLEKGSLSYEEDLHNEFADPITYCL